MLIYDRTVGDDRPLSCPTAICNSADRVPADVFRGRYTRFRCFCRPDATAGEGRATTFVMTNLPDNDSGLEVGGLFQSDGFVKITRAFNPHPAGVAGTASVGSVTVLTP